MTVTFNQQTANTLIYMALRNLNVVGRGQSATQQQINDGVYLLNELFDEWNAKGIMCYSLNIQSYNTIGVPPNNDTSGQYYTYGPGGNFDTGSSPRPENITQGTWSVPGTTVPNDLPMIQLTPQEYATIRAKQTTSTVATYFSYFPQAPLGKVYFWPVPRVATTVKFTTMESFPTTLTAASVIQFPAGYAKAIRYELIIALSRMYGKEVTPDVGAIYEDIKNDITLNNVAQRIGKFKFPTNMPGSQGAYNIYTDSTSSP